MNRIKVVTLTFDQNRPFFENMLMSYQELLPGQGLDFCLPYQTDDSVAEGQTVRLMKTDPGIRATVLSQLRGLDDSDWIYWATDDRFLVGANLTVFERVRQMIQKGTFEDFDGVLLNSKHSQMGKVNPSQLELGIGSDAITFDLREDLLTIWLHQFLRVWVLRVIFEAMPEELNQAKLMDTYVRQLEEKLLVRRLQTRDDFLVFQESLSRGIPTREGVRALRSRNLGVPASKKILKLKSLIQFILRHKQIPWYLYFENSFKNPLWPRKRLRSSGHKTGLDPV
jgi:hypothetical protein